MAATLTKEQILNGIADLSVIELSELLKEFEEKFGVTAAAPVAVAAAPAAGGAGADEAAAVTPNFSSNSFRSSLSSMTDRSAMPLRICALVKVAAMVIPFSSYFVVG